MSKVSDFALDWNQFQYWIPSWLYYFKKMEGLLCCPLTSIVLHEKSVWSYPDFFCLYSFSLEAGRVLFAFSIWKLLVEVTPLCGALDCSQLRSTWPFLVQLVTHSLLEIIFHFAFRRPHLVANPTLCFIAGFSSCQPLALSSLWAEALLHFFMVLSVLMA